MSKVLYATVLLLLALVISLYPMLRNFAAGFMLRQTGLQPGDIVEYRNDFVWLRKIGHIYTSLDGRGGEKIIILNRWFMRPDGYKFRYARTEMDQRLPVAALQGLGLKARPTAIDLQRRNGQGAFASSDLSIGSLETGTDGAPILKTDVWLSEADGAEHHVKRALLEEVLNRTQVNVGAALGSADNPTLH